MQQNQLTASLFNTGCASQGREQVTRSRNHSDSATLVMTETQVLSVPGARPVASIYVSLQGP